MRDRAATRTSSARCCAPRVRRESVDLARVERDTKIRARYLQALEDGDYAELPGAVYTKGFLRNYGAYLGLDTEYLVDLYRLESSQPTSEKPTVPTAVPGRSAPAAAGALVVTPGAIMAALLTVGRGDLHRLPGRRVRDLRGTPDLDITDPAARRDRRMTSWSTRSSASPSRTRASPSTGLRENPTVTADASGDFTIVVGLVPGSNVITLVASDPLTGRDSDPVRRTIIVGDEASPSAGRRRSPSAAPEEGATVVGPVRVTGTAPPDSQVTLAATLVAAGRADDPDRVAGRRRGAGPQPPTSSPGSRAPDGQRAGRLQRRRWPGAGHLGPHASLPKAAQEPVTRRVTVGVGRGLSGLLRVERPLVPRDRPGWRSRSAASPGRNAEAGTRVRLAADESLRIRVGNAGRGAPGGQRHRPRRDGGAGRGRGVAHHPPLTGKIEQQHADTAGAVEMADSSFDVVSDFDQQELVNALDQVRREVATRYDFKGAHVTLELGKTEIVLQADDEYRASAVKDLIQSKAVRRSLSLKIFDWGKLEPAAAARCGSTSASSAG